ncbi:hypothetical protein KBY85_14000 [Cyanobium sp. BA5m-10]|nr:hypothetical protein [Cyanobium sp. BA5m-10]MCP9905240.1 hypothetical protein [Cyanobium sp. BA5m-10]
MPSDLRGWSQLKADDLDAASATASAPGPATASRNGSCPTEPAAAPF